VKDFIIIDNFLDQDILNNLNNYSGIKHTDKQDVGDWKHLTPDTNLIFQEELSINSRILLCDYIFNKPNTPLYQNKLIKKAKAGIYKILSGAKLDEHKDNCLISLTIFLSKDWKEEQGGHFYYINSENTKKIVKNCFNTAIIFVSDENNIENSYNYTHGFTEITGDSIRYTLQLFVK
jgi:hypothetical protein